MLTCPSAAFHCWNVPGGSGNAIEVDEGRGLLCLLGVMLVSKVFLGAVYVDCADVERGGSLEIGKPEGNCGRECQTTSSIFDTVETVNDVQR